MISKKEAKAYIKRWKVVEKAETEEAQASTIQDRWAQLNALYGLAKAMNLPLDEDKDVEIVRSRWIRLKSKVN